MSIEILGLCTLIYWTLNLDEAKSGGASNVTDIGDVGGGIQIAHLVSPTGDRFGLIVNPHFKTK